MAAKARRLDAEQKRLLNYFPAKVTSAHRDFADGPKHPSAEKSKPRKHDSPQNGSAQNDRPKIQRRQNDTLLVQSRDQREQRARS